MFSLNGVALDDETRGWLVGEESQPLTVTELELTNIVAAGRDGFVPLPARRVAAPTFPLVIETPRANLQALRALIRRPGLILTDSNFPGAEAALELLTLSPVGYGPEDEIVELTALFRTPGVFWRDTAATTTAAAALSSGSVAVSALAGLSAPVRDAVIRVKGGATNLVATDSQGSFFGYTDVLAAGEWLRFDSESGRAWLTATDTWTGGTEVTGKINTGPGSYFLELTPAFTDPDTRAAVLTVTSSARTGSPTIEVRGRNAYEV